MEIVIETNSICKPDPRLAFLARASARLTLVEACEMEIGEALDGLVDQCACDREMIARWDRDYPHRPLTKTVNPKEAPSSTCDALLWELREYGVRRLKHAPALRRLSQLSNKQFADLIAALTRLQAKYPKTCSNQLLEKLRGTKWK
jgi:hypothetical protein